MNKFEELHNFASLHALILHIIVLLKCTLLTFCPIIFKLMLKTFFKKRISKKDEIPSSYGTQTFEMN